MAATEGATEDVLRQDDGRADANAETSLDAAAVVARFGAAMKRPRSLGG